MSSETKREQMVATEAVTEPLSAAWRRSVRTAVLKWYRRHGRALPWRQSADPYRIWISEIMLQQTTVVAVMPCFERFMNRFPSVHDLASAQTADVLKVWEGLGYYSRARNLHAAAREIVSQWNGQFPETVDQLQQLPGIGRYTAGAVASFAFNQAVPIVEANTLRLFARLMAMQTNPRSAAGQKQLWEFATWLVDPGQPAEFNQAVMDIGANVCRPQQPACDECPLSRRCLSFRDGLQHEIPVMPPRTTMTDVTEFTVAVRRNGRWLLRQCSEKERWSGLWNFVHFAIDDQTARRVALPEAANGPPNTRVTGLPASVVRQVHQLTGLSLTQSQPLTEIRHVVTRFRIRLIVHVASAPPGRIASGSGFQWLTTSELRQLAMPVSGRQIANRLQTWRPGH